ncbi:ferredoxin family protein [Spirochaetota bacterium]
MAKVIIKKDLCKGCQFCINVCPRNVLRLSGNINTLGYIYAEYTGEGCIGCGFCYYFCPEIDAVEVYKEEKTPTG